MSLVGKSGEKIRILGHFAERWFYLDVFACGVFVKSKNVPVAPARARQCRPAGAGHLWRGAAEHATQRSGRARSR